MENIGNLSDLSALYAAQKKLDAYNDYQTKTKKGEKVDDALFVDADINGDGKVTIADKTAINKEISDFQNSKKTPNLFDVTGDGKIDIGDLLQISGGLDLDSDGVVSDEEIKFLDTQQAALIKKLQSNSANKQTDINGDGKVDINDIASFMEMTKGRDIWNSDNKTDKYLQTIHNKLNYKILNYSEGNRVDVQDLAIAEQRLIAAQGYLEGGTKYDDMSTTWIMKSDLDKNKQIDENDVKLLETAIKSLKEQLGISDGQLDNIKTNYESTLGQVNSLSAQQKTDKAEMNALKSEVSKAQKELANAQKAEQTAVNAYNNAVNTLAKNEQNYEKNSAKLKEYEQLLKDLNSKDTITRYKAEAEARKISDINRMTWGNTTYQNEVQYLINSLKKSLDLDSQRAVVETAEAKQEAAFERTRNAQAALAEKQEAYTASIEKYNETTANLKTAKTDYSEASKEYNKVKTYFTKTELVKSNHNKDIAKTVLNTIHTKIDAAKANLETNDETLKAAFNDLTAEEKVLINELNIDLTETFADGSPKYILAKGSKDNKYHVYEFSEPNGTSAKSIIRRYAPNEGYKIIKNGNGILYTNGKETGTSSSAIIIPKKVEKPAEKELYEVMDSLNSVYSNLYEENYQAAKPDAQILKEAQKEAVTKYANNEIQKDEIAPAIVEYLKQAGTDGSKILEELNSEPLSHFGQSITNLTNKLCTILDSLKTSTELGSETSNKRYNTASPLSFDLNGDGVKTSQNKIKFDIDGDGKLDTINDSADAVLVFDADGNGIAGENGKEVFGNNTDLDGDGVSDGFANGFDALKALAKKEGLINDNADNTLDEADIKTLETKYSLGLKTNGYNSSAISLSQAGISEINFGKTSKTETIKDFDGQNNILMTQQGSTFKIKDAVRMYADIWHIMYETEDEET